MHEDADLEKTMPGFLSQLMNKRFYSHAGADDKRYQEAARQCMTIFSEMIEKIA